MIAASVRFRAPRAKTVVLTYLLLIALNVFDTIATLAVISEGVSEGNPVTALTLSWGPRTFVATKMLTVGTLGLVLAYAARTHRKAWYGLIAVTVAYAALLVWHVAWWYCIFSVTACSALPVANF